jgi:putative transposase
MTPAMVVSWHRSAFRSWWHWCSKPGRKPVAVEMRRLIRRLSRENPLWGAERIRDTLLLLGDDPPEEDTIRKYMAKPRKPRPKSTNWLPFLRNHLDVSWVIDFFAVTTLGFQVLYVFLVLYRARREVLHLAVTANPTTEWVIQQAREATPFGRRPRYV